MTGASWFFAALTRHAREHGGGELRDWLSEQELTARLYLHRPRLSRDDGSTPHPDGLGIWAEDDRDIVFLLEHDTGSEHLTQLVGKLPGYADHARRDPRLTLRAPILFCFPSPRREQSARKTLAATSASHDLQVATAALDPRITCPACWPAWLPLHGSHEAMRLIDLADVLPDPWRLAHEHDERERREYERREIDPDRR
jgi:hypothetical protein